HHRFSVMALEKYAIEVATSPCTTRHAGTDADVRLERRHVEAGDGHVRELGKHDAGRRVNWCYPCPLQEDNSMKGRALPVALAIGIVSSVAVTDAKVTRLEITKVESPAPAAPGSVTAPPYERISGKFHGELDPNDPRNALIT